MTNHLCYTQMIPRKRSHQVLVNKTRCVRKGDNGKNNKSSRHGTKRIISSDKSSIFSMNFFVCLISNQQSLSLVFVSLSLSAQSPDHVFTMASHMGHELASVHISHGSCEAQQGTAVRLNAASLCGPLWLCSIISGCKDYSCFQTFKFHHVSLVVMKGKGAEKCPCQ